MSDAQNVHLTFANAVNDSVIPLENFTNILSDVLGDLATTSRLLCNLVAAGKHSRDPPSGIRRLIFCDVVVNLLQPALSARHPHNLHSVRR